MNPVRGRHSLLLVHAHPDDESIFTGATMAKYAAENSQVTLVTCTTGQLGQGPETAGADRGWVSPAGETRITELEAACAALGVTDHRFLGAGRWLDSGYMGWPHNADPGCFWRADVAEATKELVSVINEVQPQAILTYDADGFYGHPDHIQAHRVAWRAFQQACDPKLTKFYTVAMPRLVLAEAIRLRAGAPDSMRTELLDRLGTPDDQVTTEIDATAYLDAKLAALRAHASQIWMDGSFFQVVGVTLRALGTEYYVLLAGPDNGVRGSAREDDLFS